MPARAAAWVLALCLALPGVASAQARATAPAAETIGARADFLEAPASAQARTLADWVLATRDAGGLPFVIVDKVDATVFAFAPDGRLLGASPALLGLGRGDDSAPGIGERKLSTITPDERTTPAGRFVATLGRNLGGQDIVWVDYATAISLHRVVNQVRAERRLERLATPSPLDNRISYGCINVPIGFYEGVVKPIFVAGQAIVYVLPETRSVSEAFFPSQAETTPGL